MFRFVFLGALTAKSRREGREAKGSPFCGA